MLVAAKMTLPPMIGVGVGVGELMTRTTAESLMILDHLPNLMGVDNGARVGVGVGNER